MPNVDDWPSEQCKLDAHNAQCGTITTIWFSWSYPLLTISYPCSVACILTSSIWLSIFFCVYFSFACTSFYYWSTLSLSKVFHHHFCITYPRYFCHSVVCYTSIWLYNDDILIGLLHILFMRTPKMWKDGQELSVVCVSVCFPLLLTKKPYTWCYPCLFVSMKDISFLNTFFVSVLMRAQFFIRFQHPLNVRRIHKNISFVPLSINRHTHTQCATLHCIKFEDIQGGFWRRRGEEINGKWMRCKSFGWEKLNGRKMSKYCCADEQSNTKWLWGKGHWGSRKWYHQ